MAGTALMTLFFGRRAPTTSWSRVRLVRSPDAVGGRQRTCQTHNHNGQNGQVITLPKPDLYFIACFKPDPTSYPLGLACSDTERPVRAGLDVIATAFSGEVVSPMSGANAVKKPSGSCSRASARFDLMRAALLPDGRRAAQVFTHLPWLRAGAFPAEHRP